MYPLVVQTVSSNHTRILVLILAALVFLLLMPAAAGAQPFGAWGVWDATAGKYIDIPHSADLNPTGAITIEAWVAFAAGATDLFYRLEFADVKGGGAKIYFSYPGTPSPAIIDAAAFATCP